MKEKDIKIAIKELMKFEKRMNLLNDKFGINIELFVDKFQGAFFDLISKALELDEFDEEILMDFVYENEEIFLYHEKDVIKNHDLKIWLPKEKRFRYSIVQLDTLLKFFKEKAEDVIR